MFETFQPGVSLAWDYLWQSTLFLGLGLTASMLLARRPARAHRFLLLAMFAALFSPILTQKVRREGWGLIAARTKKALTPSTVATTSSAVQPEARASLRTAALPPLGANLPPAPMRIAEPLSVDLPETVVRQGQAAIEPFNDYLLIAWRTLMLGIWLTLAGLAALRLVIGLGHGVSVVYRARLLKNETLEAAAADSAARLEVGQTPELRVSPRVRCPAIWCWGRRPVIVLPEDAAATTSVDWVGVFCHELAHWVRRDQWSGLIAEMLTCALPWHPLAWLAKNRLGQLSELACDDWVLATGLPATEYAETLLGLVPERRGALALTAVSSRRGLFGRIIHILDERRISPVVGTGWACLSAAAMLLAASVVALAQSRGEQSKDQVPEPKANTKTANSPNLTAASSKETGMTRTIKGRVIGPDGKPATGAAVYWIGQRKPSLPFVAIPRDQESLRSPQAEILARAETGADGGFSLSAHYNPDRYQRYNGWDVTLLAKAAGAGMLSQNIKADVAEVTLSLAPEVVIHGRLLTPGGIPAAGVRVTLDGFYNDRTQEGMYVGLTPAGQEVPSYWPQPRTTDADGRFTLEGIPQGTYSTLTFWHPEYAVDEVTANTTVDGSLTPGLRAFEITPVKPTFTHTLEPAKPVQGRVTDKQTGKPLVGLLVEMIPMRSHGGMTFHTRTDDDGRYRVSGHGGANTYFTSIYPPADSGYLAASDNDRNWPAGAKFLEKNFALDKGPIARGQVIDADSKQPIAGAAVVYQPKPGNPNNRNYDLRNTVVTDTDGRFAITTLPGQGFVAVETSDETSIRVPVEGNYGANRTVYPQGFATIDVSKDGEQKPVSIAVRRGVTLEAKATGPDGKIVHDLIGFCEGIDAKLIDVWNQGQPFSDGIFRLPGTDPARTYRVYLLQPERGIGAVVDLKPDPQAKQPIEVKLQPTAQVHGKVVTAGGSPMQGGQVYPLLVTRDKEGKMSRDEVFRNTSFYSSLIGQKSTLAYSEKLRSNAQGEFVIDTLLPGVKLYVMAAASDREAAVPLPPLKPGEDRDLGTIVIKERNQ
jgi:beta-lactamase regulating signal transducer with metallopeptidase domain